MLQRYKIICASYLTVVTFDEAVKVLVVVPPESVMRRTSAWLTAAALPFCCTTTHSARAVSIMPRKKRKSRDFCIYVTFRLFAIHIIYIYARVTRQ